MRASLTNNQISTNYQECLNWFNNTMKPNIIIKHANNFDYSDIQLTAIQTKYPSNAKTTYFNRDTDNASGYIQEEYVAHCSSSTTQHNSNVRQHLKRKAEPHEISAISNRKYVSLEKNTEFINKCHLSTLSTITTCYPWRNSVQKTLTQVFGLQKFRTNQLEAINTTLNGEDILVLIPPGGGKSLCYQLPSVIQNFDRKGVTCVVSPHVFIMWSQSQDLLKQRRIRAYMLNDTQDDTRKKFVFNDLMKPIPEITILYITPELLNKSNQLWDSLQKLNSRNMLARFVIVEAHCISRWSHTFRTKYQFLGSIKCDFQNVPIMALSFPVNERVQTDILHSLHIEKCKVLKQSINRKNLMYQIVPKDGKKVLENIGLFVKQHNNQSGIIYCCTKKDCEKVSAELQNKYCISIKYCHESLISEQRVKIQYNWKSGTTQVIVVPIAFEIINKHDVRFIIHYSLSSSIEGYYQETGHAGCDDLPAVCRLYYSINDTKTLLYLIDKGDESHLQKERRLENLSVMTKLCENKIDCRRNMIMSYFGENYDTTICNRMCDNCVQNSTLPNIR